MNTSLAIMLMCKNPTKCNFHFSSASEADGESEITTTSALPLCRGEMKSFLIMVTPPLLPASTEGERVERAHLMLDNESMIVFVSCTGISTELELRR